MAQAFAAGTRCHVKGCSSHRPAHRKVELHEMGKSPLEGIGSRNRTASRDMYRLFLSRVVPAATSCNPRTSRRSASTDSSMDYHHIPLVFWSTYINSSHSKHQKPRPCCMVDNGTPVHGILTNLTSIHSYHDSSSDRFSLPMPFKVLANI